MSIVSYRDLEVYQLSRRLAVELHKTTLSELPKFQFFEQRCQIRRSSKSISANLVEGCGRRRYKAEYIRFLVYSQSSCDETIEHLLLLRDTQPMQFQRSEYFLRLYNDLGRKMNSFISGVERSHRSGNESKP
jgi:four helix bundle protein